MDVFLPLDAEILVSVGQKVVAGETILAEFACGRRPRRRAGPCVNGARAAGVKTGRSASSAASTCCRRCSRSPTCSAATAASSTRRKQDFDTAAVLIGIAMILDTLDGFVARLTKTSSAFGVQLDSLADVVSFGLAPAILAFTWGLWPLKRLGWAAGFIYLTATAMRLARFNIQTSTAIDKRYFVGMPSPAAAGVIASTIYLFPEGPQDRQTAFAALVMVVVPGAADGQHDPLPQRQGDRRRLAPFLLRRSSSSRWCWR